MNHLPYQGSELELFEKAENWKAYYRKLIKDYLGQEVLEVGAGIGATTRVLCSQKQSRWLCLEPDPALGERIESLIGDHALPSACEVKVGLVTDLRDEDAFDSIIYIDVLEHLEEDREELEASCTHLRPGGFLVILSPAHQWLYTPFDKSIGHHRRYNKNSLLVAVPMGLELVQLKYLDSIGTIASLGNKLLLRSSMPSPRQLAVWDKLMIPVSRAVDSLLGYKLGKSILGVWRKAAPLAKSAALAKSGPLAKSGSESES